MPTDAPTIIDQAIDWHLRSATMDAAEWQAFVCWLEADPAHARCYDDVAMLDGAVDAARPAMTPVAPSHVAPVAANDDTPWRFTRWAAGGAVAVAAGFALLFAPLPWRHSPYAIETRPGQMRELALADGTRIDLGGGSRLVLDHADPRVASLDTGEAVFHVRHDAANPFTLRSGNAEIRDMGTVFDVARIGTRLDVAVAQGSVQYQPGDAAITLTRGQALSIREDRGTIDRRTVAPEEVGGWRSGTLSFVDTPLAEVIARIQRQTGTNLTLSNDLSAQPFSGMIRLTGSADRDVPHLAALIGTKWHRHGEQWIVGPQDLVVPR